ncbi:MAG: hypothetical protein E7374_02945 [Clostridiales bacterium]|nr:hypothetical protein [Clostridiales bacterium]
MKNVISSEFKKIFSRPGIFILSVLLAVILILGALIYRPTEYKNDEIILKGNSVLTKYNQFVGDGVTTGTELSISKKLDKASENINNYYVEYYGDTITYKKYVNNLLNDFKSNLTTYRNSQDQTGVNITAIMQSVDKSLDNLNSAIIKGVNFGANGSYVVLSTNSNLENYNEIYENVSKHFNMTITSDEISEHVLDFEKKYKSKFYNAIDNFIFPTLSVNKVASYISDSDSKLNVTNERLADIKTQMIELKDKASADTNFDKQNAKKFDELVNLYNDTANTYVNLVKYELLNNAFSHVDDADKSKIKYISSESSFNVSSLKVRFEYLFENNKHDSDFAKPLTISTSSNDEASAFDYAYFVLRIFSFVIILYAVMMGAHAVAGEIKEGTMRYLALKPVSRSKLIIGKFLSIFTICLIMILFSSIIALGVGFAVFGMNTTTILTVFNSALPVLIHPMLMLVVYLVSFIFELAVYLTIALFLSCLFKSDLLAVIVSIVLYLLNTLLPAFITSANSWLAFYPFSHISLYSLFGSTVYAKDDFLNALLGAKTYTTSSLALTVIITLTIIALLNFLSVKLFKKKEL